MKAQTYHPGEIILLPGAAGQLYRLREGLVRLYVVDDEGNGLRLRYVKPGGYFGEEALCGRPRRYFAEAVTACQLEEYAPRELGPEAFAALAEHLAEAMAHLYEVLHRVAGKRLRARVAAELLELESSALASRSENGHAVIHLTHDELAAAVGSVRETVTKVIGELARRGVLEAGYGKIILHDLQELARVAGE